MKKRQGKRGPGRYTNGDCIFGLEKNEATTISFNYILASLEKSTGFLCGRNMISQGGTNLWYVRSVRNKT